MHFFNGTMTPGCHMSRAECRKPLAPAQTKHMHSGQRSAGAHIETAECSRFLREAQVIILTGFPATLRKKGLFFPHSVVSLTAKGPVWRHWLIWSKGSHYIAQGARWSAGGGEMGRAFRNRGNAAHLFSTHHSPWSCRAGCFLLSAVIAPVLKEVHILKMVFLQVWVPV